MDRSKPNRNKMQDNANGSDYCRACDRARVPAGGKCPVCGNKRGRKHRNKVRA